MKTERIKMPKFPSFFKSKKVPKLWRTFGFEMLWISGWIYPFKPEKFLGKLQEKCPTQAKFHDDLFLVFVIDNIRTKTSFLEVTSKLGVRFLFLQRYLDGKNKTCKVFLELCLMKDFEFVFLS